MAQSRNVYTVTDVNSHDLITRFCSTMYNIYYFIGSLFHFLNKTMTQCSLCCDKWHYGSSVQDATPNLDLSSRLTNERCLTIHSIMQSPVLWLDLQIIQRADNSDTEGSRKDLLTIPPHFHRSAGLPDVQTSSQVLQATM